ncbi:SDR family oxidoreductase [soil metagenome]
MNRKSTLAVATGAALLATFAARKAAERRFTFASRVVLITGGSRGLGLVLARQLCREGAHVVILARDVEELRRAHDELVQLGGGEVMAVPCDLLDEAQIKDAVRAVLTRLGRIDVLINNAGIIEVGPLEHMQPEDFERAMKVHLWAPFTLMWELVPHLRHRGGGRIINITSIGGKIAIPHLAAYCASKFALVGLSDAMRAELARDRIYITTVVPGMMRTGSHLNAKFKGKHAQEFAWFAMGNALPFVSMNAERAAKKILNACRRAQPEITLTIPARAAVIKNALFPNLIARFMSLTNRLLPAASDSSGNEIRSGAESRSTKLTPGWLTTLSDSASRRNNETRHNGAH